MIAKVLVEVMSKAVDKTFSYLVPNHLVTIAAVGERVVVPFGNRQVEGFILELTTEVDEDYKLKEIISIDNDIVLNEELLLLGKKISEMTLAPLISCYQAMLPKALKIKNKKEITKIYETFYTVNKNNDSKLTEKQLEIVMGIGFTI